MTEGGGSQPPAVIRTVLPVPLLVQSEATPDFTPVPGSIRTSGAASASPGRYAAPWPWAKEMPLLAWSLTEAVRAEEGEPTPGKNKVQQAVPKQRAAAGQLKEFKPAKQKQQDAKDDLEAAKQLIAYGESVPDKELAPHELASWTLVANLLLNLDEVVNKN